jgi:hypothetical protein
VHKESPWKSLISEGFAFWKNNVFSFKWLIGGLFMHCFAWMAQQRINPAKLRQRPHLPI